MRSHEEMLYLISLEEVVWGFGLIGITMWIHGIGMLATMTANDAIRARTARLRRTNLGVGSVVLASLMIVFVHILEVLVWAGFFMVSDAMPNPHAAMYFSLMQYTTVGSDLHLPMHWRLLEGMIAIAGLMTFAWSTGVLFTLADKVSKRLRREARARGAVAAEDS